MARPTYKKSHIPPFKKIAAKLTETAAVVLDEEVASFAEDEKDLFVVRIEAQGFAAFKSVPLNPDYKQWKILHGLDERVMIATGWYISQIKVQHRSTGKYGTMYYVGFDSRALVRDEDGNTIPFTLVSLAWVHEKGSAKAHVPARPHWGPHLAKMTRRAVGLRLRIRQKIVKRWKGALPKF